MERWYDWHYSVDYRLMMNKGSEIWTSQREWRTCSTRVPFLVYIGKALSDSSDSSSSDSIFISQFKHYLSSAAGESHSFHLYITFLVSYPSRLQYQLSDNN